MGNIIKDIAVANPELRNRVFLDAILPSRLIPVTIRRDYELCGKCGKIMADILTKEEGKTTIEIHVIDVPSTRMVLGIYPAVHDKIKKKSGKNIFFGRGDSQYFCHECIGWSLPHLFAKSVPDVEEGLRLGRDPIVDSGRKLIPGKGCWITVTEFPLAKGGRFLNYQTDFRNFVRVLSQTKLMDQVLLAPHLT